MAFFEPAFFCDGAPVYVVELLNDNTAICPCCRVLFGPDSPVSRTLDHLSQKQGCGHPTRRTFLAGALVRFGNLPMILLKQLPPSPNTPGSVASGVAQALCSELQTARQELWDMTESRDVQSRQLDIVWKMKVRS